MRENQANVWFVVSEGGKWDGVCFIFILVVHERERERESELVLFMTFNVSWWIYFKLGRYGLDHH